MRPPAMPMMRSAKRLRELDVVHVDEHRNAARARDVGQQLHDLDRRLRIERRRRLVGEQQLRLLHHRARDADALALAAGQRVGALMREAGEPDDVEQLEGARGCRPAETCAATPATRDT